MKQSSLTRFVIAGLVVAIVTACSGDALFYRTDGTYAADVTTGPSATVRKTLSLSNAEGATTADGRSVTLANGTFTFLIYIRKSLYSPLS